MQTDTNEQRILLSVTRPLALSGKVRQSLKDSLKDCFENVKSLQLLQKFWIGKHQQQLDRKKAAHEKSRVTYTCFGYWLIGCKLVHMLRHFPLITSADNSRADQ